jgi:hypothetical protein
MNSSNTSSNEFNSLFDTDISVPVNLALSVRFRDRPEAGLGLFC